MTEFQAVSLYERNNPFQSGAARKNSSYMGCVGGELVRLLDWKSPSPQARLAHEGIRAMIGSENYPCLGAKAAFNGGQYRFGVYGALGDRDVTEGLARDLCAFAAERPLMDTEFSTFIAIFEGGASGDERAFESGLWKQLQALHEVDKEYFAYDAAVDAEPESGRFAFSFAETAFFVVGMHPQASRLARRFSRPAIVFNPHAQFDALRAKGLYDHFSGKVRRRDLALQGSLNPNLSAFGERSEARQYSGRAVEEGWKCPFRP